MTDALPGAERLRRTCVVGGAGFIGSHFVARLLSDPTTERVTVYDNFSSGREWHLDAVRDDPRLGVVRADVGDLPALTEAFRGHTAVIHLASNPDIAAAVANPAIDFDQGTLLTHHVAEAARMGFTTAYLAPRAVPRTPPAGLRAIGIEDVRALVGHLFS